MLSKDGNTFDTQIKWKGNLILRSQKRENDSQITQKGKMILRSQNKDKNIQNRYRLSNQKERIIEKDTQLPLPLYLLYHIGFEASHTNVYEHKRRTICLSQNDFINKFQFLYCRTSAWTKYNDDTVTHSKWHRKKLTRLVRHEHYMQKQLYFVNQVIIKLLQHDI